MDLKSNRNKLILYISIAIIIVSFAIFYFFQRNETVSNNSRITSTKDLTPPSANQTLANSMFPNAANPTPSNTPFPKPSSTSIAANLASSTTTKPTTPLSPSFYGNSVLNGTNGINGSSGSNGSNGTNGTSGRDGTNGTNGSNGKDGLAGTNGKDGATGPRGPVGPAGPQGPAGENGTNGTYSGIDEYTKLLLHMDGTNGSATFTDSSGTGKSISANGSTQISTVQKYFGSASGLFNGTNSYLTVPSSTDFAFGTGDFTIDFWARLANSNNQGLIQISSTSGGLYNGQTNSNAIYVNSTFGMYANNSWYQGSATVTPNIWYHYALVRSSGVTKLYINGASVISQADSVNYTGTYLVIGGYYTTGYLMNGNIDELRISKGVARWTANFTPPTAPYDEYNSDGTGGTITHSGGYTIHTFTGSGTFTPPAGVSSVDYLVVAGGGSGGSTAAGGSGGAHGGGGAGAMITGTSSVTAGAKTVTVGTGGSPAYNGGNNGGNSVFDTITALGGGSGGSGSAAPNANGKNGGSGGGAYGYPNGSNTVGTGSTGGNNGGNGHSDNATWTTSGGGGGAGAVGGSGGNSSGVQGAGGAGLSSSISGSSVTYAVGGSAGNGSSASSNTGNGGGGSVDSLGAFGGTGGSGIVIIRYLTPSGINNPPTGSPTYNYPDGYLNTSYQSITKSSLLTGFTDTGDTMSISGLTANNGTIVNNGNDTYTFIPNTNFSGTVTLSYNVTDTGSNSVPTTDTFNILNQDPYTKLLLHMDGTNGSATFMDSSGTSKSVTAYGNAQLYTAINHLGSASGMFDGNGDYLSVPNSTDFDFSSGDFTIDFWLNSPTSGTSTIINKRTSGSTTNGWTIFRNGTSLQFYASSSGSSWDISNGTIIATISNSTWVHIALVRLGNVIKTYQNGVLVATINTSSSFYSNTQPLRIGSEGDGYYFTGFFDELRISKGIARWTTNFTPPSSAYAMPNHAPSLTGIQANLPTALMNTTTYTIYKSEATNGLLRGYTDADGDTLDITSTPTVDHGSLTINGINWYYSAPNNYTGSVIISYNVTDGQGGSVAATQTFYVESQDPNTKLLLHMDGPNNSTQFVESSFTGKTISSYGTVHMSTTQGKFNGSSGYFSGRDGTVGSGTGSFLVYPNHTDWNISGSDFTVDTWVYMTLGSTNNGVFGRVAQDGSSGWGLAIGTDNKAAIYDPTHGWLVTSTSTIPTNTWTHLAVVRSSGTWKLYINGTQNGSTSTAVPVDNSLGFAIGELYPGNGAWLFNGYIDEFRYTKGLARWTSNFTPPTGAYQQSNSNPVLSGSQASLTNGTEDTTYIVSKASLLTGFTDPDGDTLSISTPTSNHGNVVDNGNNTYTLTPTSNYNGSVTFSYNATDGRGGTLAATLGLTLTAVNDAPALTGSKTTFSTSLKNTQRTLLKSDLIAGYTDVDGDTLNVSSLSADHGTITPNGNDFTFTPTNNYTGTETLSYNITDGNGGSVAVTNTFNVYTVAASGGTITTSGNYTIHTFTTSGTFTLAGSTKAEVLVVAGGGAGGIGGGGAGGLVYQASRTINSGSYTATVGNGGIGTSGTGSNGQNSVFDTITALGGGGGGSFTAGNNGGSGGGGSGDNNDSIGAFNAGGISTQTNSGGGLGYGNNGSSGGWIMSYGGLSTGAGGGGAGAASSGLDGGIGKSYNISGTSKYYAGGGGGSPSQITVYVGIGGLGGGGNGNWNGSGYPGTANTGGGGGGGTAAVNGNGGSGIVIVRYLTNYTNGDPILSGTKATLSHGSEDTAYIILKSSLLSGFSDPDNDTLDVSNVTINHGSLSSYNTNVDGLGHGGYTFTPTANYNGSVTISYDITDGNGGSLSTSNTFTLDAVNDAPTLSSSQPTMTHGAEDTAYVIAKSSLLSGFSDIDGDTLDIVSGSLTSNHGLISSYDSGTSSWTLTPTADYNGTVTLSYTITDSHGGTLPATIALTLDPSNDAPSLTGIQGSINPGTQWSTDPINILKSVLLQGFTDIDGDTLDIPSDSLSANHGTLSLYSSNIDGSNHAGWNFTPTTGYKGTVTLDYAVSDGHGGSVPASNHIDINGSFSSPQATYLVNKLNYTQQNMDDTYSIYANHESGVTIGHTTWHYIPGTLPGQAGHNIGDVYDYNGKHYLMLGSGLEGIDSAQDVHTYVDITSELALTCDSTTVHMLPDIGGIVGGSATGSANCNIMSSDASGWELYIRSASYSLAQGGGRLILDGNTTETDKLKIFEPYGSTTVPSAWNVVNNALFGYNAAGTFAESIFNGSKYAALYESDTLINDGMGLKVAESNNPSNHQGDNTTFNFKAELAPDTSSSGGPDHLVEGNYTTSVQVTAISK